MQYVHTQLGTNHPHLEYRHNECWWLLPLQLEWDNVRCPPSSGTAGYTTPTPIMWSWCMHTQLVEYSAEYCPTASKPYSCLDSMPLHHDVVTSTDSTPPHDGVSTAIY